MNTTRRQILGLLGIACIGAVAGCSGSDDEDGNNNDDENENGDEAQTPAPIDPETAPQDLLPEPDELRLGASDDYPEEDREEIGANAGVIATYQGGGDFYSLHILRFDDPETASTAVEEEYPYWLLSFSHGVFVFAVEGDDAEVGRDLLAASSGLSEEIVNEKT